MKIIANFISRITSKMKFNKQGSTRVPVEVKVPNLIPPQTNFKWIFITGQRACEFESITNPAKLILLGNILQTENHWKRFENLYRMLGVKLSHQTCIGTQSNQNGINSPKCMLELNKQANKMRVVYNHVSVPVFDKPINQNTGRKKEKKRI